MFFLDIEFLSLYNTITVFALSLFIMSLNSSALISNSNKSLKYFFTKIKFCFMLYCSGEFENSLNCFSFIKFILYNISENLYPVQNSLTISLTGGSNCISLFNQFNMSSFELNIFFY